jgi:hypothetical protein
VTSGSEDRLRKPIGASKKIRGNRPFPPDEPVRRWLADLPSGPGRLLFFPCLWSLPEAEDYVVWFDARWKILGGAGIVESKSIDGTISDKLVQADSPPGPAVLRHGYVFDARGIHSLTFDCRIRVAVPGRPVHILLQRSWWTR